MTFFQNPPKLTNQFLADDTLQRYLERVVPDAIKKRVTLDLTRLGSRVVDDIWEMCVDARKNEPTLRHYDAWGKRIDDISVSHGWQALGKVAVEEGMIAMAYERHDAVLSRVIQAVTLYLFNPSSAMYTCPLAMSDGAARLIEVHGSDALKTRAFNYLTSRNAAEAWTSGQWMTERSGGSDISRTETRAVPSKEDYLLYGTKWFTSATNSQMAMTLARIDGDDALSLFYVETRLADGALNHIEIHRLKDKMGTRAMPTAELSLNGTVAQLVGKRGRGVAQMATLFNVTRIYNAITSVGYMRRGLALAFDYAQRREVFGKKLCEHPLHMRTLSDLQSRFMVSFHLVFHVAELQGKVECKTASEDEESALRLLTPIVKLFTAKESVSILSEVLECFGGAGYIEDTDLPVLLRDAQVLPIWEGTTNVLSLDALRAVQKENAFMAWLRLAQIQYQQVRDNVSSSQREFLDHSLKWLVEKIQEPHMETLQVNARSWAMTLAKVQGTLLLGQQAQWEKTERTDSPAADALQNLEDMAWLQTASYRKYSKRDSRWER